MKIKEIDVLSKALRLTTQLERYRTSFRDCIVRHLKLQVYLLVYRFCTLLLYGYGISCLLDLTLLTSIMCPSRIQSSEGVFSFFVEVIFLRK